MRQADQPRRLLALPLAVLGIVVTVSGLFVLLSDALFADVESLVHPDGRHSLFRHPRRTRLSLAALAVFATLLGVELTALVRFMADAGTLHRDPIGPVTTCVARRA